MQNPPGGAQEAKAPSNGTTDCASNSVLVLGNETLLRRTLVSCMPGMKLPLHRLSSPLDLSLAPALL